MRRAGRIPRTTATGPSNIGWDTCGRSASSEQHLDYVDRLRTSLRYQGSTVALIVFTVLILGIQRVLSASEIATILSGIAGFVLGQSKSQSEPPTVVGSPSEAGGGRPVHPGEKANEEAGPARGNTTSPYQGVPRALRPAVSPPNR